jgi:hypothetical protein
MSTSGCVGTLRLAKSHGARGEINTEQRMMAMARVYEKKGEFELAHRFYCQVLQKNPGQTEARSHANDLLLAMREAQPSETTKPASPEQQQPETRLAARPRPARPAAKLISDEELAARVPKRRHKKPADPIPSEEPVIAAATFSDRQEESVPTVTPAPVAQVAQSQPAPNDDEDLNISEVLPSDHKTAEPVFHFGEQLALVDSQPAQGEWKPRSLLHLCPDAHGELRTAVENLSSHDVEVKKRALEEIVGMGNAGEPAIPALHACLKDSDPVVQAYAAWAVWESADDAETAMATLRTLLVNPNDDAATFACYVLGCMGSDAQAAIEDLATAQNHSSLIVRAHAAEAMLKISDGNSGSVIVLDHILQAGDADERGLAVLALSSAKGLDRSAAIDSLIATLSDPSPAVRSSAALTLGSFGNQAARASVPLQQAVATADDETRTAVETALACINQ